MCNVFIDRVAGDVLEFTHIHDNTYRCYLKIYKTYKHIRYTSDGLSKINDKYAEDMAKKAAE